MGRLTVFVLPLLILLGACSSMSSRPDIEENDLEKAKALYDQGEISYKQNDLDTAEKLMQETVRLDPTNFLAHYRLGTIRYKTGKTDEAADEFLKTIKLNPRYSKAHYNLASIRLMQARDHFKYFTATTDPKTDISGISVILGQIEEYAKGAGSAPSDTASAKFSSEKSSEGEGKQ